MSIRDNPYYTLPAATLAEWIESQPDRWWFVDGDDFLMSVLDLPCPADELAPMLRKVGKDLLVYDKTPASKAHGEMISADQLDGLCDTDNRHHYKTLLLCWADSDIEWLLVEDKALVPG